MMVFTDIILISSKGDKGSVKPLVLEDGGLVLMCQVGGFFLPSLPFFSYLFVYF